MILLLTIGLTLFFSCLAAWAYRYGGDEKGIRWVREVGLGICLISELIILDLFNWVSLLCLGAVWIESTYFKRKGTDANWFNWLLVGLSFSVAILPWFIGDYVLNGGHWLGFLIRIIVCAGLNLMWQELLSDFFAKKFKTTNDITDERGRGALQILTLPLLLIKI